MRVDGRLVDIEIQVASERSYADRALYYWAVLYGNTIKKGQSYDELMATIQINIVCFDMFEGPEWFSEFKVMECERHEVFSENLDILVFETTKLPKTIDRHDKIQLWLKLFSATTDEDLKDLEQMGDTQMARTAVRVMELSEDERVAENERIRKKIEVEERYRLIAALEEGIVHGRAEGRAEGMAQGEAKGRAELVSFMASQGRDIAEIAALTGLTETEVSQLLS